MKYIVLTILNILLFHKDSIDIESKPTIITIYGNIKKEGLSPQCTLADRGIRY